MKTQDLQKMFARIRVIIIHATTIHARMETVADATTITARRVAVTANREITETVSRVDAETETDVRITETVVAQDRIPTIVRVAQMTVAATETAETARIVREANTVEN